MSGQRASREWGIAHASNPYELHRGPMTEAEAVQWIAGWVEDGGRPETFVVLSREVGAWKPMARMPLPKVDAR